MNDKSPRKYGANTGKQAPPAEHQFKLGNPGKPKGARNKLGEDFINALQADFADHGPSVIEAVRIDKPDQYLKVIASILPKDINLNVNQFDNMTDEQIVERIRKLDAAIRPFLDAHGASGAGAISGRETAH